jgi:hypothetical protein
LYRIWQIGVCGGMFTMNLDKDTIDSVIMKLHIQPVGNGYIDMICPIENIGEFIDSMEQLGVKIKGFTWWCHVCGCHQPCGLGGPKNKYGDGWFSEIPMGEIICFESNEKLKQFLLEDYPKSKEFRKCYMPAFWLDVN